MRAVSLWLVAACGSSPAPALDPDAPGPTGDAPPSITCGTRTGMRGLTRREVTVDGQRRTYLVYLPEAHPAATPLPLVFVHHGYTMSGEKMHEITGYAALADSEGIAIAFPDGQGGPDSLGAPWNVGTGICPSLLGAPPVAPGDDFAFLEAMRADIEDDQCLDRDHQFVTGFSMGGYFAHHANCMRADLRAAAPHSGGAHDLADCPAPPKPIIIFHGLADGVIPPACSDPRAPDVPNATASADAWARHNGCQLTTAARPVEGGTCFTYDGCPAGRQVELCTFDGMGHCWAGGAPGAGIYSCPDKASATQLAWDFFRQHAW